MPVKSRKKSRTFSPRPRDKNKSDNAVDLMGHRIQRSKFLALLLVMIVVGAGLYIVAKEYYQQVTPPKDVITPTSPSTLNTLVVLNASTVQHTWPHDPHAFTQGLFFDDGFLIESTGGYKTSTLRRVNVMTGLIQQEFQLPSTIFGEGVARWKDTYIMLSYKSKQGFVIARSDLTLQLTFTFETVTGMGWGITSDGVSSLIVSDGSSTLLFWDPDTLIEIRRVTVRAKVDGPPIERLNELEYVEGYVVANVWLTNTILVIDPDTGLVIRRIDASVLARLAHYNKNDIDAVLNGIAYRADTHSFYLTGKRWDSMFELNHQFFLS